jgi:hypothetical protein
MRALLRDPRQLLRALPILAIAALVPLLMRLPLRRLEALIEPRRPPERPDAARQAWLERHVDDILAAGHPVVRPGCLTRGVTHYFFLRRAGVDLQLQFGIGRPQGRDEGHCWLVRNGKPYLERVDPRPVFISTYAIPAASQPAGA